MARAARQLKLSGVFAAAVTPNRAGTHDADCSALLELLDFLAAGGADAICVMGSIGEFLNFSFSDRQRLVYLGTKRSRVPLIAGVGHSTLIGSLQMAEEAIAGGADGLLLMPPYFYRYEQKEIEEFYRVFAQETGDAVPILLDNIPQFTSNIGIETVRRLLDTSLFAGVIDSSGDACYFGRLAALKKERPFALFSGSDRMALQALEAGADGLLSGCAGAVPELVVAVYRAFQAGNRPRADELQRLLGEFADWMDKFPVPTGIKRAVELRGQKAGQFGTPLAPETARQMEEFPKWFRNWWIHASAGIR